MSKGIPAIILFWSLMLFCLTPWCSPPIALLLGLLLALILKHPYKNINSKAVKYLLQFSVVGLGFGMNFNEVVSAGKDGVLITMVSILATLAIGYAIGRLFKVEKKIAFLISIGTAVCGGSAIAAMAPVVEADEHETAVSLGTVFVLNAIALLLFPWVGKLMSVSAHQFGLWSAIAIHDTSSVVGAAAHYGNEALKIATTVKLTRALWIVPLAFVTALLLNKRGTKINFPYFILAFVAASIIVSLLPSFKPVYGGLVLLAHKGLTITLFLIGAGLSKDTIKTVGFNPIMQGVLLWLVVSGVSLWVIVSRLT